MSTIVVDINAEGNIASEAQKASDAMARLAANEKKVGEIAKRLGESDLKKVAKAVALADKAQAKSAAAAIKRAKAIETANTKSSKEREKWTKKLIAGDLADVTGLGAKGVAAQALIGIFAAAAAAALGVGAALSVVSLKAFDAKMQAQGILGVLTAGRGAPALEAVDGLASQIGLKLNDARNSFIKFRQAGADNTTSANLLKLTADLNRVDSSGRLSAEAIEKVLAHKNADGTVDIKLAAEQMKILAKQAGVAGDGAFAAQGRFTTLAGALNSIDNSKTQFLEKTGEKLAPIFDAAAGKVALMLDRFVNSEQGAKAIDKITSAISFMVDGVMFAIETAGDFVTLLDEWSPVLEGIAIAVGVAGAAFMLTLVPALVATAASALAAAAPFIAIGAAIGGLYLIIKNWDGIWSSIKTGFDTFLSWAPSAGGALIEGFLSGFLGMSPKLIEGVKNTAMNALKSFKSVLGINSPSTAFAETGEFSAIGYTQGWQDEAPAGGDLAASVLPEKGALQAVSRDAGAAAGEGASQGFGATAALPASSGGTLTVAGSSATSTGGGPISVTVEEGAIVIQGYGGDKKALAEEVIRGIRREADSRLSIFQLSRGIPA